MTPEEREDMEIIYGLNIQPPAPKSAKNHTTQYWSRQEFECPDCGLFVREVGYKTHWSKSHRQAYQIAYFKRWRKGEG